MAASRLRIKEQGNPIRHIGILFKYRRHVNAAYVLVNATFILFFCCPANYFIISYTLPTIGTKRKMIGRDFGVR
jgi:hypothetical protein